MSSAFSKRRSLLPLCYVSITILRRKGLNSAHRYNIIFHSMLPASQTQHLTLVFTCLYSSWTSLVYFSSTPRIRRHLKTSFLGIPLWAFSRSVKTRRSSVCFLRNFTINCRKPKMASIVDCETILLLSYIYITFNLLSRIWFQSFMVWDINFTPR